MLIVSWARLVLEVLRKCCKLPSCQSQRTLVRMELMSLCASFFSSRLYLKCNKNLRKLLTDSEGHRAGLEGVWFPGWEAFLFLVLSASFTLHLYSRLNLEIFKRLSVFISIIIFMSTLICCLLKHVVYLALLGTKCHLELKTASVPFGIGSWSPLLSGVTLPSLSYLSWLAHS